MQRHLRFRRRAPALAQVARRAGGDDILPCRPPAIGARHDVIERQVAMRRAAILAGEAIAQEQVEAREGRELRRPHILLERDHRGQLDRLRRAAHLALIMRDDVDAIEEHRLHRRLPRPDRERIIGKRRVIGVQDERRARVRMADQIGMEQARVPFDTVSRRPYDAGDDRMMTEGESRGQESKGPESASRGLNG